MTQVDVGLNINPAIQDYLTEAGKGNMLLTSVSVGSDSEANQLTSYGNASRPVWIASAYASFSVRGAPGTKGPRGQGVSKARVLADVAVQLTELCQQLER